MDGRFAAAGASLGLLVLNRPNALVFAVAAAVAVVLAGRVKRGAVLVASLLAVLAANAARNYAVSGDAVVIASHGGLNLYIGNHDRADGTYTPVPGITPSIAGQATIRLALLSRARAEPFSGEVSSYFAWRAFDWVTGHPADALGCGYARSGFCSTASTCRSTTVTRSTRASHSLSFASWRSVPGCFCRLACSACSGRRCARTAAGIGSGRCSSRYGAGGGPLLRDGSLPDALVRAAVRHGWRRARSVFRPGARPSVRVAAASSRCPRDASLVVFSNLGLDNGIGGEQTRTGRLVEQGSFDEARRLRRTGISRSSSPGVLRFSVAQALLDAARPDEAAALLVEANAIDGPRPAIRLALGEALIRTGRATEAVGHLEAAYDSARSTSPARCSCERCPCGPPRDAVRPTVGNGGLGAGTSEESALDFGTLALEQTPCSKRFDGCRSR